MTNNYYALAHEQAASERAEVRAQLEVLLARDAKLEKLVSALKDVLPVEEAPVAEAAHSDAHAGDQQPAQEHHDDAPKQHEEAHEQVHEHAGEHAGA
jgi:hypothetical protein